MTYVIYITRIQNNIRKSVRTRFGIQKPSLNLQKKIEHAKNIWQKIMKGIINLTRVVK